MSLTGESRLLIDGKLVNAYLQIKTIGYPA